MILELFVIFILLFIIFLPIVVGVAEGIIIATVVIVTGVVQSCIDIYKYFKTKKYV